jgi:hypothetical protein
MKEMRILLFYYHNIIIILNPVINCAMIAFLTIYHLSIHNIQNKS